MNWFFLIEILSNFSFVFTLLNFIFIFFCNIDSTLNIIFFLLTVSLVYIAQLSKSKFKDNNKISYIILLFLFSPIIFVRSIDIVLFLCAIFIYSIFYIVKNVSYINYNDYVYNFGNHFYAIIFILLIFLLNRNIHAEKNIVILYLILYLILSAITMRILRNIKYNIANKKINELIIKYTTFTVIFAFLFSLFKLRKFITFLYTKFIDFICNSWLFKHFLLGIANFLYPKFEKMLNKFLTKFGRPEPGTIDSEVSKIPLSTPEPKGYYFILVVKIILIVLAVFIVYKLMKKNVTKSQKKYYTESNEFILPQNKILNNLKKNVANAFNFKNYNYVVRNYYKKYLKLCLKKDIEISKNDTSYDVYKKSYATFNHKILDNIRKIYIRVRYDNFKCDKNTLKEFKNNYNNISK